MIIFKSPLNSELENFKNFSFEKIWAIVFNELEIPLRTFRTMTERESEIFYSLYLRKELTLKDVQKIFKERTGKTIRNVIHLYKKEEDKINYMENLVSFKARKDNQGENYAVLFIINPKGNIHTYRNFNEKEMNIIENLQKEYPSDDIENILKKFINKTRIITHRVTIVNKGELY